MKEYYRLKETIVTIQADERSHIEAAKDEIVRQRMELERYISFDPFFRTSLEPYAIKGEAPEIVKRMTEAAKIMDIGPMSAVAGTISAFAVEVMVGAGASFAIVDNGGDIAIINDRPVVVGIYAGNSPLKNLGFTMEERDTITGICTSSGTVGPSISFGMADAAVVFSDDVALADSAATALGNATGVGRDAVEASFNVVSGTPGIKGAILIQGEYVGLWGDVPPMTRVNVNYDCITKG
ncbi:MAG: UPF0280 family protein [Methanolobus sp.]|uniref:UPF0280 family protein n=1 Tax=Methanolobus sp. TaxID=1874737 RepID=UPI002730BC03|nr:UPF0280 family protein [Methanolobus sp.]MDP2217968.1 UPF0280 family protein [Methanolobus sp.]